jgi:hypothetical protein
MGETSRQFSDIEKEAGDWAERNFPNNDPMDCLLGLGEEVGELYHAHLKGRQGVRYPQEEIPIMKKDAVGDIVLYLFDYCRREGFTVWECLQIAWETVRKRDWLVNPLDAARGGEGG